MQAAELVASQGRYPDARAYLNTVLEKRLAAGDVRGAAMTRARGPPPTGAARARRS